MHTVRDFINALGGPAVIAAGLESLMEGAHRPPPTRFAIGQMAHRNKISDGLLDWFRLYAEQKGLPQSEWPDSVRPPECMMPDRSEGAAA